MDNENDTHGGNEVEDQLHCFQEAVDNLREALHDLKANPPEGVLERQRKIVLIHRLKQEVHTLSESLIIVGFRAVSCCAFDGCQL